MDYRRGPAIAPSRSFNTTTQLANAVGVAVLGTLFFEVAERQLPAVPTDVFGPAYEVVLVAVALLMAAAYAAARALPAAAPAEVPEVV